MLLCCIIPSSLGKTNAVLKEVALRCSEIALQPPYGLKETASLLPSTRDHRRHLPLVATDIA